MGCSRPKGYDLIEDGILKTFCIGSRRFTTQEYIEEAIGTLTKKAAVRHIKAPRTHQETVDAINARAEADIEADISSKMGVATQGAKNREALAAKLSAAKSEAVIEPAERRGRVGRCG